MAKGTWWAIVRGCKELDMTEWLSMHAIIANLILTMLSHLIITPTQGNAWGARKGEDLGEEERASPQHWERQVFGYRQTLAWSAESLRAGPPQGWAAAEVVRPNGMAFLLSSFFPTGQVDLDLLRRQQLKLYVLKAGRALLSHQDQLRQILSQPAVQEAAAAHTGIFLRSSFGSVRKADTPTENRQGTRKGKYR